MSKITDITTGEQSIAAAGPATGTLDTSALTGAYNIKCRVSGLATGKKMMVSIEDTANASAFSDALPLAVFHFTGGFPVDGITKSLQAYDIPNARFGITNSKLRVNVTAIDAGAGSPSVHAWIEQ